MVFLVDAGLDGGVDALEVLREGSRGDPADLDELDRDLLAELEQISSDTKG